MRKAALVCAVIAALLAFVKLLCGFAWPWSAVMAPVWIPGIFILTILASVGSFNLFVLPRLSRKADAK